MTSNIKLKVYVAMSGGVDSSVATALLKKQGHDVVGVFFKPWQEPTINYQPSTTNQPQETSYCNWQEDRLDVMRVCAKLDIRFKTWDFSREYGKLVTKYMIDAYRAGITPNPDVMCNKEIKFGLFLKKALADGANMIATGHYARIKEFAYLHDRVKMRKFKLLTAKDNNKDQSYFLYNLSQKELKYCLFPIGEYTKPEVRKLAKKFGLPNHAKRDSQGVCFVGQLDMKEFLQKYIKPKAGDVKLIETGKVIGRHDGVYYYTIGQRHGLNLGIAGGPYFVVKKDLKKNIIFVSMARPYDVLDSRTATIKELNWTNVQKPRPRGMRVEIKIRYRSQPVPAIITMNGASKNVLVKFLKPGRAVTPGQSAVFYKGNEVLGGGVII